MPLPETETFEMDYIPRDRLEAVVADYMADAPLLLEKIKQADGNWMVRATYSRSPSGAHSSTATKGARSKSKRISGNQAE